MCKYALQTQCVSIMFLALFLVFCANWWLFSETYEVTKTNKASMLYRSVPHNSVCPVSITLLTLPTWPKVVWGKVLDKYNWRNFEMNTTHNFWWLYCSHYQYAPGAFTLNSVNFAVNTNLVHHVRYRKPWIIVLLNNLWEKKLSWWIWYEYETKHCPKSKIFKWESEKYGDLWSISDEYITTGGPFEFKDA